MSVLPLAFAFKCTHKFLVLRRQKADSSEWPIKKPDHCDFCIWPESTFCPLFEAPQTRPKNGQESVHKWFVLHIHWQWECASERAPSESAAGRPLCLYSIDLAWSSAAEWGWSCSASTGCQPTHAHDARVGRSGPVAAAVSRLLLSLRLVPAPVSQQQVAMAAVSHRHQVSKVPESNCSELRRPRDRGPGWRARAKRSSRCCHKLPPSASLACTHLDAARLSRFCPPATACAALLSPVIFWSRCGFCNDAKEVP